ncbi:U-box domain-containing protein 21 [Diospyros lotus]|uniref:U-box domain-containing protein 21 n=1 Tax=Diospyros lotus TaxID=55363 RepID=UPI00225AFEAE|nr:U-box domain-containing protein 21 [Diospyros lotus]
MILPWRRRGAGRRSSKVEDLSSSEGDLGMELAIPKYFRCPISLDLMKDPVTLSTGITYDRENIEKWIESGNQNCPITNQVLRNFDLIPNHAIRRMIQDWCVENRSHGVERIPTPRIPVSPGEVLDVCSKIEAATQTGDRKTCLELVEKVKKWARESERSRLCIVESGAGCVFSASLDYFSSVSIEENESLLAEILSSLTWMFPLGEEGQSRLASASSLRCMAGFLNSEDLSARQNAVLVLKELLSLDQKHVNALAEIEGVDRALVKIIKDQICPKATNASLVAIYYITSSHSTSRDNIIPRFLELGIVSLVLEILLGGERRISEKALGVLDGICGCRQGVKMAGNHALTTPVVVKKILRVSEMATEFSVSILWKLCKSEDGGVNRDQLTEALSLGAFQKLLVVLQVGCSEKTKEKATELLKLLNQNRERLGCSDSSMVFKHLKRP